MEKWFVEVPHSFKVEKKAKSYIVFTAMLSVPHWQVNATYSMTREEVGHTGGSYYQEKKTDYLASQAYICHSQHGNGDSHIVHGEKREQNWLTVSYTDVGLFLQLLTLLCHKGL